MNGNRHLFPQSLREIIPLEQPRDGISTRESNYVFELHRVQPLGVEADFRLGRIEDLEDLRLVRLGVPTDVLPGHWRPGDVPARWVADQPSHVADQEDNR